ncbi:unnamed protein product [Gordionus sp. m RMFG-2023]|uniref:uncharacterized protein LOC135931064 n=1 Tax=Gordionus sp. m RMFG-2023 TaxID=3053472 RepID=UPI0030DF1F9B
MSSCLNYDSLSQTSNSNTKSEPITDDYGYYSAATKNNNSTYLSLPSPSPHSEPLRICALTSGSADVGVVQNSLAMGISQQVPSLMMMVDSRICRDFLRGVCKRGPACKFIHHHIMDAAPIPLVCRDHRNGICVRGSTCKYQHIPLSPLPSVGTSCNEDCGDEDSLMMVMMGGGIGGGPVGVSLAPSTSFYLSDSRATSMTIPSSLFSCAKSIGLDDAVLTSRRWDQVCGDITPNTASFSPPYSSSASHAQLSTADKIIPVCRDYMKGKCDRGFRCRFRHITMADYRSDSKERSRGSIFKEGPSILGRILPTVSLPTVVVSAASGPLFISHQPHHSALQYSLSPLSMQSCCPLTYVTPASATINILDPGLELPLTKRRLRQQAQQIGNAVVSIIDNPLSNSASMDGLNNSNDSINTFNNVKLSAGGSAGILNMIPLYSGSDFNNINNSSGNHNLHTLSHSEKALVEENESLKQRLNTLKKQIAELNATVDMLLEQNRRLRLCGMGGGIVGSANTLLGSLNNTTSMTLGQIAQSPSAAIAPLTLLAAHQPHQQLQPLTQSTLMIGNNHQIIPHSFQTNISGNQSFNISDTSLAGTHLSNIQVLPCINQSHSYLQSGDTTFLQNQLYQQHQQMLNVTQINPSLQSHSTHSHVQQLASANSISLCIETDQLTQNQIVPNVCETVNSRAANHVNDRETIKIKEDITK